MEAGADNRNDDQRRRKRKSEAADSTKSPKRSRSNHSSQAKEKNADDSFPGFVDPPSHQERQRKKPSRQQRKNRSRQKQDSTTNRQRNGKRSKPKRNQNRDQAGHEQGVSRLMNVSVAGGGDASARQTLQWQTVGPHVPVESEHGILDMLMPNKKKERGMIRDAGDRHKKISKKCKQVGMHLTQALSLRRQYMRHLNPRLGMKELGLGRDYDILRSATLFEAAVETYVRQCSIQFLTEAQQKASVPKGTKTPPTPDFMLLEPTLLSTSPQNQPTQIHWIEAKMFYGASSITNGSRCAAGQILATAEKYVRLYGAGAMVFMFGCGKEMAEWLLQRGVVALDAHPLDLRRVEKHQRSWCANKSGLILP